MAEASIQSIGQLEQAAVLRLNNEHATELSLLDAASLARMIDGAFYARRVGHLDAFLLAFDQSADYNSPNFRWFCTRHPRFVYVDRMAVAPQARGRKLARLLYEDLFAEARAAGHCVICCEVNSEPANPASDAFHAALGFQEVGVASLQNGKSVRYFNRPL